ncbi:ABC transporter substrate-binding protein [Anaerolentibacter hominis]|uniref:ABC transporter substrate-binding protein n=1 Tax=Anaerolentibacter hominis TaxID=3079009 RepID=UPI0031B84538
MKTKKLVALLLCLALVVGSLTGCSKKDDNAGDDSQQTGGQTTTDDKKDDADKDSGSDDFKGTIKLGGLAPLTGNYAEYGKGFQVGFAMAIEEINAKGGANGYKLEIEIKDSQGDPVTSSTLCTDFAEDDEIMAILGDFTSGACKANAEIVDRYGIVQLSPTASADDYAEMSEYCFSIMGRQDVEAPFLAKYILNKYLEAKKIAVIRVDSDWGLSCYSNFEKQAKVEGLDVTVETYATGEKDFSSLITKMKATNPDVLVVMDQGDAVAQIFNQADAAGWEIQHVALGPGTSAQVADQLTDKDNLILTSPFFFDENDAELTAWKTEFESRAGFSPTIHPACAYDCIYLIANAIEKIGDGEVTRDAIRDALASNTYEGVTGQIVFTEAGDIKRNYMICGLKEGKWTVLEGFEYGAAGV